MSEPQPPQDPSKWEAFQTWKGPPADIPPWAERLLRWVVHLMALALLFAFSGGVVWVAFYMIFPRRIARHVVEWEPEWFSWARFIGGGLVGTAVVLWWFFVRDARPADDKTRRKRRRTRR